MSRRDLLTLVSAAGVSLGAGSLLAGCQSPSPARSALPGQPAATGAPAATVAVIREKLSIAQAGEPPSMDPTTAVQTPARMLFNQVYSALTHRQPDGKLVPRLAEKWERPNDTTVRFYLRKGVKFTNGEDFNADSVKFTMDRYADPKSQAANSVATIREVKVIDAYTVDFITKVPDPLLLPVSADQWFMVPPKYYQEKGAAYVAANPVGTGPFILKEWVKADHITVTANKDYWGGPPKVQTVVWRFIPEDATRVAAVERGEVDLAIDLPPAMAGQLKKNQQINITTAPDPAIVHVGFNMTRPIFKDMRVRQAMNYAVNKQLLIERVLFGYGTAAGQVAAPGTFGHNPDVKPYSYDPDKAKKLLADAGQSNGFTITMRVPTSYVNQSREVSQVVVGDLEKVGIKVNIQMTEFATLNQQLLSKDKDSLSDTYLWLKRYPSLDAGQTLNTGFLGGEAWNYGAYVNPKVDEQIKKQASSLDERVRQAAIFEAAKIMNEDDPVLWLYWAGWVHAARKGVDYAARPDGLIYVFDEVTYS